MSGRGERVSDPRKKSNCSDATEVCSRKVGRIRGSRRLASPRKTAPLPPLPVYVLTTPKVVSGSTRAAFSPSSDM